MSVRASLYDPAILSHSRSPRHRRGVDGATHGAEALNPLCGDRISVELRVVEGVIVETGFQGEACAIATAAASMLTERLMGLPVEEFAILRDQFHRLLKGDPNCRPSDLGELAALQVVAEYPARVSCATLASRAIGEARHLDG